MAEDVPESGITGKISSPIIIEEDEEMEPVESSRPFSAENQLPLPFIQGLSKWADMKAFFEEDFRQLSAAEFANVWLQQKLGACDLRNFILDIGEERRAKFISVILPFLQRIILKGPSLYPEGVLPLFRQGSDMQLEINREQCTYLLACAFFGLFAPTPNYNQYQPRNWFEWAEMPPTNIRISKHICIFCYFEAMSERENNLADTSIIVARNSKSMDFLGSIFKSIETNQSPLVDFEVSEEGGIGDRGNSLEMDFANAMIGGGVLNYGNVQEEIMFTVRTECLVSLLLCERMEFNESIIIIGSELFSEHIGYGGTFQFTERHHDETSFFQNRPNVKESCIVAIDALQVHSGGLDWKRMQREMCKCYAGFSWTNEFIQHDISTIETGNWGCGMFGGHPVRKAMLQWISASLSTNPRKMVYYNFQDRRTSELAELTQAISEKNITVGQLAHAMHKMADTCKSHGQVVPFLKNALEL